jgi:hypothetical protein
MTILSQEETMTLQTKVNITLQTIVALQKEFYLDDEDDLNLSIYLNA